MYCLNDSVIFPPPYVRSVIDKTAQFVAKNGDQFEQRIRSEQNECSRTCGSKFSFLEPGNAYNAYYRLKLSEIQNGIFVESKPSVPQAILDKRKRLELKNKSKERLLALTGFSSRDSSEALEEPERDTFSLSQPFISSLDMDILKSTALFVARNGQKFLLELTKRERNNPQFDFLSPSHYLFNFFTALTEAYTKCLLPPKSQIEKLNLVAKDRVSYLKNCHKRADWDAKEAAKLESDAMLKAAEKAEMQSIDWHTFFIAETIKFNEYDEGLPSPIDFSHPSALLTIGSYSATIGRKILEGDAYSPSDENVNGGSQANDVKTDESTIETTQNLPEDRNGASNEAPQDESDMVAEKCLYNVVDTTGSNVSKFSDAPESYKRRAARESDTKIIQDGDEIIKLKKSYTRKSRIHNDLGMQKCPITGQMVPAEEMSSHLQILLLDPKWKKQKDKFMERAMKESAFAPLEDVEANLAVFVAGRPDIFGSAEEEVLDHTNKGAHYFSKEDRRPQ